MDVALEVRPMLSLSNITAYKVGNYAEKYAQAVNSSIEKLSSGQKVNSAKDNPGDTSFISKFKYAIESQRRAMSNVQDTISMMQTADSAISGADGILSILNTIREKVVAAGNATLTSGDRQQLQTEILEYIDEIGRVTSATEFNTRNLLNGDLAGAVTSSDSALKGYAKGLVESGSYYFDNITGASKYQTINSVKPEGFTGSMTDPTDYTGVSATINAVSGTSTSTDSYEVVFDTSTTFKVYNSGGTLTASSSLNTAFRIDGLLMKISSSDTYDAGLKLNFDTNTTSAVSSYEEGNRGTAGTLSNASWSDDAAMHSYFNVKYDYDGGTLKYNVFDINGSQMGNWTTEGEEFTSFASSILSGSKFTFSASGSAIGDAWKIEFGTIAGLETAGGTFTINSPYGAVGVSYDGNDKLSTVAAAINALGDNVVSAQLQNSANEPFNSAESITNASLLIEAFNKGAEGIYQINDNSGNFVSSLGFAAVSGTGTNASFLFDGKTYNNSTGIFEGIIDNIRIEVKDEQDRSRVTLQVIDKSIDAPTNMNNSGEISLFLRDLTPEALGLKTSSGYYALDVTSDSSRNTALSMIDNVVDDVAMESSRVGAVINSLSSHVSYLNDNRVTYESVYSNHVDADFAFETAEYYENKARFDAASAMIAQANLMPQRVLSLLGID